MVKSNSDAQDSNQSPVDFQYFTRQWSHLQSWFTRVLQLKSDEASFADRYGSFQEEDGVREFIGSVAQVKEIAQGFGNPGTLKQRLSENPEYLFSSEPPHEPYAHLVWLVSQIENAAGSFNRTLSELEPRLDPSAGSPRQRAQTLKNILAGQNGLMATANDIKRKIQTLRDKITPFEPRLTTAVQAFIQSDLLNQANEKIGANQGALERLQPQTVEAYEKWKGHPPPVELSDEAPSEPSESGGSERSLDSLLPWKRKKKRAKQEYKRLKKEIEAAKYEIRQKALFVDDLKGFFMAGNRVVPALLEIDNNLGRVDKVFRDAIDKIVKFCSLSDDDQLSSYTWVARALDLTDELKKWQEIKSAAQDFVQHAMISLEATDL